MAVTSGFTSTGGLKANSDGATAAPVAPNYTHAGVAAAATVHQIVDSVTAVGASTAIVFTASTAGPFTVIPVVVVIDQATGVPATMTATAITGFTFTSISAHVYSYIAIGI